MGSELIGIVKIRVPLEEGFEPVCELGIGEGFEPGLGDRQCFGGTGTGDVGLVEAEVEPHAAEFVYGPEGAENSLGAGFEAGAGEADVCQGDKV
jgi:hypothetical protein